MNRLFAVWLLLLGPVPGTARADHKPGEIVSEARSLALTGSQPLPYELGTLYVRENRADPNSRVIGVGFARFRAAQATTAPPTFHLPGGPGNSFLTRLPSLATYVQTFRPAGDVVIMDQRGFSERGDILKYRAAAPQPLDQPASLERHTADFLAVARATVAKYAAEGIDLRGYTVQECADDVDELRKALGYEQINLVGVSFGSQWSFAIMRRHPGMVARALLGGVEPLNCGYDMPSHILAAVQRQWWEAEKDTALQPYLPKGGLMAAARTILRRLEQMPARLQLTDERGKPTTVVLGPEDFQKHFLGLAASPGELLALYHERCDGWARVVLAERRSTPDRPLIGPLIDTSLGVTSRRQYLLRTDPAVTLLGQWNFDSYLASAGVWPTADVGDAFRTEVPCSIPVVFVQGDWDVQTPVENLLEVVPFFPQSRTLLVERGGHGALGTILQRRPDIAAELVHFLKTGAREKLPSRVTLPATKLAPPHFPPPG